MNYETLEVEKRRLIWDLAEKAILLRPALAGASSNTDQGEKIANLARSIAKSIEEPVK
jgi:hypothetical protein